MTEKSKLFLWDRAAMLIGGFMENEEMHDHHAVQIVIGYNTTFEIYYNRAWHRHRVAVIAADTPHRLKRHNGLELIIIWIDDETTLARRIALKYLLSQNVAAFDANLFAPLIMEMSAFGHGVQSCEQARSVLKKILCLLLEVEDGILPTIDPRIQKALKIMNNLDIKKVSAKEIANKLSLSESRFSHLFSNEIGIPFRRYLLWLRIRDAIRLIVNKNFSLTDAAHCAHFSDAAHLSRSFKNMFGRPISKALKNSRFIQAISCRN